jgi:hypothetical protein
MARPGARGNDGEGDVLVGILQQMAELVRPSQQVGRGVLGILGNANLAPIPEILMLHPSFFCCDFRVISA